MCFDAKLVFLPINKIGEAGIDVREYGYGKLEWRNMAHHFLVSDKTKNILEV